MKKLAGKKNILEGSKAGLTSKPTRSQPVEVTKTGGRDATTRHIPPTLAQAVGMPSTPAPKGWQWTALTKLARMESDHSPSGKHPEYRGGTIPWIGIQDVLVPGRPQYPGGSQAFNTFSPFPEDDVVRIDPDIKHYLQVTDSDFDKAVQKRCS